MTTMNRTCAHGWRAKSNARDVPPGEVAARRSLAMDSYWRAIIWQQFGAAIDMLDNAVRACPDELWHERLWDNSPERPEYSEVWFLVSHTLYWLDLYLSGGAVDFAPPARFSRDGLDPEDPLPEQPYTKDE